MPHLRGVLRTLRNIKHLPYMPSALNCSCNKASLHLCLEVKPATDWKTNPGYSQMAKKYSIVSHQENASQNHNEIHVTGTGLAIEEKRWRECRKTGALRAAGRNAARCSDRGRVWRLLRSWTVTTPTATPLLGMCPKKQEQGLRQPYAHVHSSIIQMSVNGRMEK